MGEETTSCSQNSQLIYLEDVSHLGRKWLVCEWWWLLNPYTHRELEEGTKAEAVLLVAIASPCFSSPAPFPPDLAPLSTLSPPV